MNLTKDLLALSEKSRAETSDHHGSALRAPAMCDSTRPLRDAAPENAEPGPSGQSPNHGPYVITAGAVPPRALPGLRGRFQVRAPRPSALGAVPLVRPFADPAFERRVDLGGHVERLGAQVLRRVAWLDGPVIGDLEAAVLQSNRNL